MPPQIQTSWPYDEHNKVANKIVRKYRHEDEATFCFKCGGDLSSWGPTCRHCGQEFERLTVTRCPTHERTFVHLHAPMVVGLVSMEGKNFVQVAEGFAFCEACGSPHLYEWERQIGVDVPTLTLVDLDGHDLAIDCTMGNDWIVRGRSE